MVVEVDEEEEEDSTNNNDSPNNRQRINKTERLSTNSNLDNGDCDINSD